MFKKITIIGMGLIGSSLARAIRKNNIAEKIISGDINPNVIQEVKELKLADAAMTDLRQAVMGSDLTIIAVPPGAFHAVGEAIGPALKAGSVVTDVGSVKQSIVEDLSPYIPDSVQFVPSHPIAGTENSGPRAGFAELFEGRWCILTPVAETDIRAVETVTSFWEACGSRIEIMSPEHHDMVLGITSHLPHLIAFTIVGTANELEDELKAEVIKYSAGGFRSFTRIAASDPVMWRDVFLGNKSAVLEILQRFTEDLTALQKAIRRGDGRFLEEFFTETRSIRRSILDLGPEGVPSPERLNKD